MQDQEFIPKVGHVFSVRGSVDRSYDSCILKCVSAEGQKIVARVIHEFTGRDISLGREVLMDLKDYSFSPATKLMRYVRKRAKVTADDPKSAEENDLQPNKEQAA